MSDTNITARVDRATYLVPSPYENDGNELIGRHPEEVAISDMLALGHPSPIKAIRAKCIDCSGNSVAEARKCVAINCPLWPFRMGKNIFRGKATRLTLPENKPRDRQGFYIGEVRS